MNKRRTVCIVCDHLCTSGSFGDLFDSTVFWVMINKDDESLKMGFAEEGLRRNHNLEFKTR